MFKRALAIKERELGSNNQYLTLSLANLAYSYFNQKKWKEAEPIIVETLRIREKAPSPEHSDVAATRKFLRECYQKQGKKPPDRVFEHAGSDAR